MVDIGGLSSWQPRLCSTWAIGDYGRPMEDSLCEERNCRAPAGPAANPVLLRHGAAPPSAPQSDSAAVVNVPETYLARRSRRTRRSGVHADTRTVLRAVRDLSRPSLSRLPPLHFPSASRPPFVFLPSGKEGTDSVGGPPACCAAIRNLPHSCVRSVVKSARRRRKRRRAGHSSVVRRVTAERDCYRPRRRFFQQPFAVQCAVCRVMNAGLTGWNQQKYHC